MDKNNTTVSVWFDVLVSVLDVGPDLMLPDILLCFEIQHLFDTWDRRHTQHVTEVWEGVRVGSFASLCELQLSRRLLASSSYVYFPQKLVTAFTQPQPLCVSPLVT